MLLNRIKSSKVWIYSGKANLWYKNLLNLWRLCICRALLLASIIAVSQNHALTLGDLAPNFSLPILGEPNQRVSLNQLKGKWVYLDFWASWCVPCKKSLPVFERMYQEHQHQGFQVLAISLDNEVSAAQSFVDTMKLTYPVLLDKAMASSKAYSVIGMPTSFLINPHGAVVWKHQGFQNGDDQRIPQEIARLIKKQPETAKK